MRKRPRRPHSRRPTEHKPSLHLAHSVETPLYSEHRVNPALSDVEIKSLMVAMQSEVDRKSALEEDFHNAYSKTRQLSAQLAKEHGLDEETEVRPAVAHMLLHLHNLRVNRIGRALFPAISPNNS